MKLVVDEMPKEVWECPYSEDKSTECVEEYRCTWNKCDRRCFSVSDCPFFTDKKPEAEAKDDSEAYKTVFDNLTKCNMFKGIYDAKNGSEIFMNGISTVMENVAYGVSEECYEAFTDEFTKNLIESQEKAKPKRSKTVNKDKKSNIKCEHCRYWKNVSMSQVDKCTNTDSPKYDTGTHYWNRCKCFEWKEETKE